MAIVRKTGNQEPATRFCKQPRSVKGRRSRRCRPLTLGGRVLPMNENDVLEVFPGNQPPATDIIRSATFARNVKTLSAYLAAAGEE